jgi:hypothetical protein
MPFKQSALVIKVQNAAGLTAGEKNELKQFLDAALATIIDTWPCEEANYSFWRKAADDWSPQLPSLCWILEQQQQQGDEQQGGNGETQGPDRRFAAQRLVDTQRQP